MFEQELLISTKHGTMPSFVASPDRPGPFPAVVLFMDAPGIREELRNHARRIARAGFYCVLPDQYYRLGLLRFDLTRRDQAMSAVIGPASRSLTDQLVLEDTAGIISFLDAQDRVTPGPLAVVGHCAGGRHVLTAARHFPDRIVSAAALYPVRVVEDGADSPHLHLGGIEAELYFGFGALDPEMPADKIAALEHELQLADVHYDADVFEDVHHGYQFAEKYDGAYDPHAAEVSWAKVLGLFGRTLANR